MNFEDKDIPPEKSEMPERYQDAEQFRTEVDPWMEGFDAAYNIYSEFASHLETRKKLPHDNTFGEFDTTFSTVIEQVFQDCARAYYNEKSERRGSASKPIDPDVLSETLLWNLGFTPDVINELPRVSRFGTFAKDELAQFQPRVIKDARTDDKKELIRIKMESAGVMEFIRDEISCSIGIDFSEIEDQKLGRQNIFYPFEKVRLSFVRSPLKKTWDFEHRFGLGKDYKDLGFQSALIVHPRLARQEAKLIKLLLDIWCGLPEETNKRKFRHYSQANLEAGFQSRLLEYVSDFSPIFAEQLMVNDSRIYRKIADYLNDHPDTASFVQYSLFR